MATINDRQLSRQKIRMKTHLYKHFCFQDKTWIEMQKWTIFLISSKINNSQSKESVLITEIFWQMFWLDNWQT